MSHRKWNNSPNRLHWLGQPARPVIQFPVRHSASPPSCWIPFPNPLVFQSQMRGEITTKSCMLSSLVESCMLAWQSRLAWPAHEIVLIDHTLRQDWKYLLVVFEIGFIQGILTTMGLYPSNFTATRRIQTNINSFFVEKSHASGRIFLSLITVQCVVILPTNLRCHSTPLLSTRD